MNEKLYQLIACTEGVKNSDGSYTTALIYNAKYPGGTNQVEVETVVVRGKKYKVIVGFK